jgi:hypothetical protein
VNAIFNGNALNEEILVVDDNSPNTTISIFNEIKKKQIKAGNKIVIGNRHIEGGKFKSGFLKVKKYFSGCQISW